NDAKEFKRKREAEKKARQRAGYYVLPVQVHLVSVAQMLLVEGHLAEKDLDDVDAISKAVAAHLRAHQHHGRILADKSAAARPRLRRNEIAAYLHEDALNR